MTSEARRKREKLLDKKKLDDLKVHLKKGRVLRFHDDEEIPEWVRAGLGRIRRTESSPQDSISCDVERAELLGWMRSFLWGSGIRGILHLSTGVRSYPWVEFEPLSDDWLEEFTEYRGYDFYVISKNFDLLVVFFEEEYRYEAFCVGS